MSFSELGIRSFELGVVLGFACDLELFSYELSDFELFKRLIQFGINSRTDSNKSKVK